MATIEDEARRGRLAGLVATRDALARALDVMGSDLSDNQCAECGGHLLDPGKMAMFARQLADTMQQIEDLAPGTGKSQTDALADELARRRAARARPEGDRSRACPGPGSPTSGRTPCSPASPPRPSRR